MSIANEHKRYLTKVGGHWRTPGRGPADDLEVRFGYSLIQTPAMSLELCGVELSEFRVTRVDVQWRCMLKGLRRNKPVVAFFYEDTYKDVLVLALTSLDLGRVKWYPDKFPL